MRVPRVGVGTLFLFYAQPDVLLGLQYLREFNRRPLILWSKATVSLMRKIFHIARSIEHFRQSRLIWYNDRFIPRIPSFISHPESALLPLPKQVITKVLRSIFVKGHPDGYHDWSVTWVFFQYNGWPSIPLEAKLIKYSVPSPLLLSPLHTLSLSLAKSGGFSTEDLGKLLRVLRLNFLCVWLHDSISMCFDPCVNGAGSELIATSRWCYREQTVVF